MNERLNYHLMRLSIYSYLVTIPVIIQIDESNKPPNPCSYPASLVTIILIMA